MENISSKICCLCLKQVTDESQVICSDSIGTIHDQLIDLVPEFTPRNIILTSIHICIDCTPDLESTVRFKKMYKQYGLCSQNREFGASIDSLDGLGDILVLLPSSSNLGFPIGESIEPSVNNDLQPVINGGNPETPNDVRVDTYLAVFTQNRPTMLVRIQVIDNGTENNEDDVTYYITFTNWTNTHQPHIEE